MNCFIGIGNSDNHLSQADWATFIDDIDILVKPFRIHGRWFSAPDSAFQNAAWCIEFEHHPSDAIDALRPCLALLAKRYQQDSIALTCGRPEFIGAAP